MILNEFLPLNKIKIIATDIDAEILVKAKTGFTLRKALPICQKNMLINILK